LRSGTKLAINFLWNKYFRFYKRLLILYISLLEIISLLLRVNNIRHKIKSPDILIRFIHYIIKEFFIDTIKGREILSSNMSSLGKRLSALLYGLYLYRPKRGFLLIIG
jgi:hypothetical protein